MANKMEQKMMYCNICKRRTMHYRNNKEMSWLMHLFLTLITAGMWLIVWVIIALWHILTKPIGGWVCSIDHTDMKK